MQSHLRADGSVVPNLYAGGGVAVGVADVNADGRFEFKLRTGQYLVYTEDIRQHGETYSWAKLIDTARDTHVPLSRHARDIAIEGYRHWSDRVFSTLENRFVPAAEPGPAENNKDAAAANQEKPEPTNPNNEVIKITAEALGEIASNRDDPSTVADQELLPFLMGKSPLAHPPVGTEKAVKLMSAPTWDDALLTELAQAMTDAARQYLYGSAGEFWDAVSAGGQGTTGQRAAVRLATAHAMRSAVASVELMYRTAGTAAIPAGGPLDRRWTMMVADGLRAVDAPADAFAFRAPDGTYHGRSREDVTRFCRSADLFLNVSGSCWLRGEDRGARRTAYLDSDPGYTQAKILAYDRGLATKDEAFSVALVPHTKEVTTLGRVGAGDELNIEVDMLAKYIEKLAAG